MSLGRPKSGKKDNRITKNNYWYLWINNSNLFFNKWPNNLNINLGKSIDKMIAILALNFQDVFAFLLENKEAKVKKKKNVYFIRFVHCWNNFALRMEMDVDFLQSSLTNILH